MGTKFGINWNKYVIGNAKDYQLHSTDLNKVPVPFLCCRHISPRQHRR